MIYLFLYPLHEIFSPFNVFRYITFRTAWATITALLIAFFMGPWLIKKLKEFNVGQQIRNDGPKSHLNKAGTPTMGGILIVGAIVISTILWTDLRNKYIWLLLFTTISLGILGFIDDYLKIKHSESKGLRARHKFLYQIIVGTIVGLVLYFDPKDPYSSMLIIPFFKRWFIDLGFFYIPFAVIVIVGASNAVNLTDGIDGLATGLVGIAAMANAAFVYISGHAQFSKYLQVLYLPGTGELTIFCGAMLGACLGFLWYNTFPAEVFMGDVGSLSLGGALGALAVITKHEIVLTLVGGIFVIEALSVIFQVGSYKLTGKRVFKMAPIHHHFELKGWPEPKVIIRFWIVGILLALLSLSTLKLR